MYSYIYIYTISYLKFKSLVPSSSNLYINTNSDPPPNNPSENSNTPYIPVKSTPSINVNSSTIKSFPVVHSLKSNHISIPSSHNSYSLTQSELLSEHIALINIRSIRSNASLLLPFLKSQILVLPMHLNKN